jgi:hypothetical protein
VVTPIRIERTLSFVDEEYQRASNPNQYMVYDIKINDLYDPNPLILSGSVTGFAEQMNFYEYYRVLNVEIDLEISNNENFGVLWGFVLSNIPLTGVIGDKFQALSYLENGFTTGANLLAAKGGSDRGKVKAHTPLWKILGNKRQYMADDNYVGKGLASPNIPLYFTLIVGSSTSGTLTNGVTTYLKFNFRTEFFQKKALST